MTIEEATALAGWIQKAFPHHRMTPRLYMRALVHYEFDTSSKAILKAIEHEWRSLPTVYELVAVLLAAERKATRAAGNICLTCEGDKLVEASGGEYAPCPACHPLTADRRPH